MKITDDYKAKIRLWVTNPRVVDCPVPEGLPHFGHQSFDSLDEMNAWKRSYRAEIAKLGGGYMEELIEKLNRAGVQYLLIGGQAARLSGVPRFSMDWELYLPQTP